MKKIRTWWIVAGVAGLLIAVVAGFGAVSAQTPVPGTSTTGTTLLQRVADKLGIDVGTVRDAVKSAESDQIDAKVASGELTQAQADQLKQQIANASDQALLGGPFGRGPGMGRGVGPFTDPAALASFLGITEAQLRTEQQASGATLATVAQAHGKSRDELKTFITTQAKTRLDQEVAAGEITQAQEDTMLSTLSQNIDQMIDATGGLFGHDGFGRGPMDGADLDDGSTTPSATTTATAQ